MKVKHNQQLLVEGKDDLHVISALCAKYEVPENFSIIDCNGIDNLIEQIPQRLMQSNINSVGIIIDADTDIKNRWQLLKSKFETQGYILPIILPTKGLIIQNNQIIIGIWIMPNNYLNGMLEDFISFLIPKDDKLLPIVTATLNKIEAENLNSYSLFHKSKAIMHTWLAWQENPGTPMGLSITKRFLNTDEETCLNLVNWIKQLFKTTNNTNINAKFC